MLFFSLIIVALLKCVYEFVIQIKGEKYTEFSKKKRIKDIKFNSNIKSYLYNIMH